MTSIKATIFSSDGNFPAAGAIVTNGDSYYEVVEFAHYGKQDGRDYACVRAREIDGDDIERLPRAQRVTAADVEMGW